MVRLATHAGPDHVGRVRRRAAAVAGDLGLAKSLCVLLATRPDTVCDRADQWRSPMAAGFHSGRQAEGVDLRPEKLVQAPAVCPVHLSPCSSDRWWFFTNLRRVCSLSR